MPAELALRTEEEERVTREAAEAAAEEAKQRAMAMRRKVAEMEERVDMKSAKKEAKDWMGRKAKWALDQQLVLKLLMKAQLLPTGAAMKAATSGAPPAASETAATLQSHASLLAQGGDARESPVRLSEP